MLNVLDQAKADPNYQAQIFDNTNFTWQVLRKMPLTANDKELSELFMSLSGTVIIRREGDANEFTHLASLATDEAFIKALLSGGETTIYQCDTADKCLNPLDKLLSIAAKDGFASKVRVLLDSMVDKIFSDLALSESETALLQTTQIPVYKMLSVQSALTRKPAFSAVSQYADMIALDILMQYLQETLQHMRPALASAAMNMNSDLQQQILSDIDNTLQQLLLLQQKSYRQAAVVMQLIEQTQTIERMLAGELSSQLAGALQWTGN